MAHSGYVKNMVFVRLGILISWKGTRERGNPCKKSVKKIPQMTCVLIREFWCWQKSAKHRLASLISTSLV